MGNSELKEKISVDSKDFNYLELNKGTSQFDDLIIRDLPRLIKEEHLEVSSRVLNSYFNYHEKAEYTSAVSCILNHITQKETSEEQIFLKFLPLMRIWQAEFQ
jgi:hypothetical protein